jgi:hypothetical protein
MITVNLQCDAELLKAALHSLAELAELPGEVVQCFLDGLDPSAQLFRIDCEGFSASGTSELRIAFQPSDLLVEFLAAMRAGN